MKVGLLYIGEVKKEARLAHLCRWVSIRAVSEYKYQGRRSNSPFCLPTLSTSIQKPGEGFAISLSLSPGRLCLGSEALGSWRGCAQVNDAASLRTYHFLYILSGLPRLFTTVTMLGCKGVLEVVPSCDGQPLSWRV